MQSRQDTTEVLDGFRRVFQALREGAKAAEAGLEVSGAQLFVLQVVAQSPGLSLNELAERTRTHQSSVSVVVTRLVEAGLLRRERSSEDARRIVLSLTAKSRKLLAKVPDVPQHRLIAAVESLPKSQRFALVEAMRAITSALDLEGAPPMFFEPPPVSPSPRGGEGRGEGKPRNASARKSAPHPNPLPAVAGRGRARTPSPRGNGGTGGERGAR